MRTGIENETETAANSLIDTLLENSAKDSQADGQEGLLSELRGYCRRFPNDYDLGKQIRAYLSEKARS